MRALTTFAFLTVTVLAVNSANAEEFVGPGGVLWSNRCNSVVTNRYFQYPVSMAAPVGWTCRLPDGEPGVVGG